METRTRGYKPVVTLDTAAFAALESAKDAQNGLDSLTDETLKVTEDDVRTAWRRVSSLLSLVRAEREYRSVMPKHVDA